MNSDTAASLTTLVVCAIVLFLLALLMATPAVPLAVCLSKSEARELWPRQHLYWYSSDHCWSNRHGPPRNIRQDLIRENHAESLPAVKGDRIVERPTKVAPIIIYPPLNMLGSVPSEMLNAYAATTWPLILDVDEETDPELGVTKDGCCWPKLEGLVNDRSKPMDRK